eukprot:1722852-Prymnesium_polylepis.1
MVTWRHMGTMGGTVPGQAHCVSAIAIPLYAICQSESDDDGMSAVRIQTNTQHTKQDSGAQVRRASIK